MVLISMDMSKPTKEVLRFISENQKLAGFSGRISKKTAHFTPDMDKIAKTAKQFGAQTPIPKTKHNHE
jgi:hypothetical protein